MLKNTKKVIFAIIAFFLVISTTCFAATTSSKNAKLEIVENNICTIKINDFATFEKKIVDYDLEKKELTIGLSIKNTAEVITNAPYEVVLVIDNSLSMIENKVTTDTTRLKAVTDSAKKLTEKLFENENMQIAVVSFSTGSSEGTISDATLRTKLTSNSTTVLSSINEIATDTTQGPRTNIDAGLQVAKTCFSKEENNKYIILLTDGVPNTAVGGPTFTYSADTAIKTKATLQNIDKAGINVISAMIGLNESVIEPSTQLTYKYLAEEIFGTNEEPTVGKFYYIPDKNIEKSICETIFSNIVDTTINTLTNIDIYDYFPQEIVDNFNFEYVSSPNLGKVSPKIDTKTNCIIWHIDKLEPQTSGSLSYKLTLKDNIDSSIIDLVLNTNKKVDITANEIKTDDGKNVISSTVTPKVKVTLPKAPTPSPKPSTNEIPASNIIDNTISNTTIPQTGSTTTPMIVTAILVISCIVIGIRFYILDRKTK